MPALSGLRHSGVGMYVRVPFALIGCLQGTPRARDHPWREPRGGAAVGGCAAAHDIVLSSCFECNVERLGASAFTNEETATPPRLHGFHSRLLALLLVVVTSCIAYVLSEGERFGDSITYAKEIRSGSLIEPGHLLWRPLGYVVGHALATLDTYSSALWTLQACIHCVAAFPPARVAALPCAVPIEVAFQPPPSA